MIIGGLQTGNTRWLAAHLQNAADNESVEATEFRGTIATDIDGALTEFDAITSGTRAREGVYAAFINPPEPLTRDQYMRALAVMEQRLGLTGQPRIVLFHVKNGREHCHVVWSRIDISRMKAIHLSHDRQKLRRCARELAAEFGTKLPPGLAEDRGAERFNDPPQPTRAEKAQMKNSGFSPEERRAAITQAWRMTDNAESFINALEAFGYMLARGDRRAYVVVDIAGDVHSLARQIDGARTKDVKMRLEGVLLSQLPPVERAKILMAQRAAAQKDAARAGRKKQAEADAVRERVLAVQRKRRAALDLLWQKMKIRHMHEWKVLLAHLKAEKEHRIARRHWLAVGLALYLRKIRFIRQLLEYYEQRRKSTLEAHHQALMEGVRRRHENEAAELRRRYAALSRLERCEDQTFARRFGEDAGGGLAFGRDLVTHSWQQDLFSPHVRVRIAPTDNVTIPAANSLLHFYDNALDIAGSGAPDQAGDIAASIDTATNAYWGRFRENAFDITMPGEVIRFTEEDSIGTGIGGGPSGRPYSAPPAGPGV